MRKRRASRRSHLMLRNASIVEPKALPNSAFVGSCCKMFFPMDEVGGTTITDAINGAIYTPDSMTVNGDGSIVLNSEAKTLTSGAFPVFADKSFILFAAYRGKSNDISYLGLTRSEQAIRLTNAAGEQIGYYDGDAMDLVKAGHQYGFGTETLYGAIPAEVDTYYYAATGAIRDGDLATVWLHNNDYWNGGQPHGFTGPYIQAGDVLSRNIRNDLSQGALATPGVCGRSDYGIDTKYVDYYYDYTSGNPPPRSITDPEGYAYFHANELSSGIAGSWGRVNMGGSPLSVGTLTHMNIGTPIINFPQISTEYYGIAIFVFEDGLPSDFKQALRWMRDQWFAGNKVIWPNWVTVT